MSVKKNSDKLKVLLEKGVGKAISDEKMKRRAAEKLFLKLKKLQELAKDAMKGAVEGVKNMLSGDDK